MSPIYIIQSLDSFLTEKKIQEIKKQYQIEDNAISHYDLEETTLDKVLEDLDTYSFLSPKKCIIVSNPTFLMPEGAKIDEKILEHFENYIKKPNPDHILILLLSKLDERKRIGKVIKQNSNLINISINNSEQIRIWLKGYSLEEGVISLLLEYCKENTTKLYQECEKLKMYSLKEKYISKQDVKKLVERELDHSDTFIFSFINDLVHKNKKECLKKYQDLLSLGYEPIAIIGMLANQFRFLYQVKVLVSLKKTKEEIRIELDCHPYRIEKAKESCYYYSEAELLNYIEKLAQLDYQIKSGEVLAKDGLETLLLAI